MANNLNFDPYLKQTTNLQFFQVLPKHGLSHGRISAFR